ncbi:hypothetical protein TIFTF001_024075 [Ficus carica]|uniref:Uncharacterized protein n=1 Tax=Ficus carica TaxID=3494 RepID=A0AA88APF5_FICCA|nr:hypothetical protein TIFTF001_024075 [Ficus carica]
MLGRILAQQIRHPGWYINWRLAGPAARVVGLRQGPGITGQLEKGIMGSNPAQQERGAILHTWEEIAGSAPPSMEFPKVERVTSLENTMCSKMDSYFKCASVRGAT